MTVPSERCEACRFDGQQYDLADTRGTLRALGAMWRWAVDGIDDDGLRARPAPGVWSAVEYASHSADVTANLGRLVHGLLAADGLVVDPAPPPADPTAEAMPDALERLAANLGRVEATAGAVAADDPRWHRVGRVGEQAVDAAWALRHVAHDVSHHLMDVGRGLHLLGAGAPTQEGTVVQVNASDGGVPKRPVKVAEVGDRGLVGDRQADRKHHGRPLQALCLWSLEVIEALQAEGHPVEAGAAGENLTLAGLDWSSLRPGTQLLIGDVLAEVSAWATPCAKNAQWFAAGDFKRMDHERHPGWSRAYAWVREPGTIRAGDAVIVEP